MLPVCPGPTTVPAACVKYREQQHTHSAQSIYAAPLPPAGVFPHPLLDECDPSCGIVHIV